MSETTSPSTRAREKPLVCSSAKRSTNSPLRPWTTGASTWKRVRSSSSSSSWSTICCGRLPGHRLAADRAVRPPGAGEEQAEVVVDLGDGADRRARVAVGRLLVDRDRRREALDEVDVGLVHLAEELPRVGRQRLDVAPLALGEDRVERQRRLARPGQAGEDDEAVAGEVDGRRRAGCARARRGRRGGGRAGGCSSRPRRWSASFGARRQPHGRPHRHPSPPTCRAARSAGTRAHRSATALPIEDYAVLGDRGTAALVSRARLGRLAVPAPVRLPACFARAARHARQRPLAASAPAEPTRRRPAATSTTRFVLETTHETDTGRGRRVTDLMPLGDGRADMLRRVEGSRGHGPDARTSGWCGSATAEASGRGCPAHRRPRRPRRRGHHGHRRPRHAGAARRPAAARRRRPPRRRVRRHGRRDAHLLDDVVPLATSPSRRRCDVGPAIARDDRAERARGPPAATTRARTGRP